MSKIRILFTIPNFDTAGSGKAMLNIALRLNKDFFEPHIACLHDGGAFFEKVKTSGIPYHILPLYSPARPISQLLAGVWKVSRQIKEINPDIVHSYNYSADYTEGMAVRLAGKKWIFTKKNMSWSGASTNSWRLRSSMANMIAVQNTDMMKDFYPGSKKTFLIPRGVNTKEFYPRTEAAKGLREKWGIALNNKIIICVANLVKVKGIEVLLKAFNTAQKTQDHITLLIVGDNTNEYGQQMMELAKTMGIADKVVFTGKQQNIPDYHTIADIFVLPTLNEGRREGSPVALLEALASGTISIASDVPGIRDQLHTFPDLMFTAGSDEELAVKLLNVLALKPEQRQDLKRKLTQLVNDNYKIEYEVARHEQLYMKCMGRTTN